MDSVYLNLLDHQNLYLYSASVGTLAVMLYSLHDPSSSTQRETIPSHGKIDTQSTAGMDLREPGGEGYRVT